MMTFEQLTKIAQRMGVTLEEDHVGYAQGYWLLDSATGDGVWEDENFSTSLYEVEDKLQSLADERGITW